MPDNETSGSVYRASKFSKHVTRKEWRPPNLFVPAFSLCILLIGICAVYANASIKANLLAASRPERIIVRIPTPVPVPGPERVVERICPACRVIPQCSEYVTTIRMSSDSEYQTHVCEHGSVMHTTIHDGYVILECRCPDLVHLPAAH